MAEAIPQLLDAFYHFSRACGMCVWLKTAKFQADVRIHSWRSARRGLNHREDGSKVVFGTLACTTQRPKTSVVIIIIIGAKSVQGPEEGSGVVRGCRRWRCD